jgi:hypothetical protein
MLAIAAMHIAETIGHRGKAESPKVRADPLPQRRTNTPTTHKIPSDAQRPERGRNSPAPQKYSIFPLKKVS